jgi:hypothetical protein
LIERVSKLDAARRQLRTAIRLFFADGDTVSIHTLTAAVQGLLRNLLTAAGKKSPLRQTEEDWIKPEHWKDYLALVNAPQNFFKHADSDPDDVFDFRPEVTAHSLLECVIMYQLLTGRMLREGYVFFVWIMVTYPNWIKEGEHRDSAIQAKAQLGSRPTKTAFRAVLNRADLFPNTD